MVKGESRRNRGMWPHNGKGWSSWLEAPRKNVELCTLRFDEHCSVHMASYSVREVTDLGSTAPSQRAAAHGVSLSF